MKIAKALKSMPEIFIYQNLTMEVDVINSFYENKVK
jgi:hypothetical protein